MGLVVLFGLALFLIERIGGSDEVEENLDADSYGDEDNGDANPAPSPAASASADAGPAKGA
jgi:hypothetical protein